MKRRGRPAGTRRLAVLDRMRRGSFTMRDIVSELGVSVRQADWLLRDMRDAGQVAVLGSARLPGAKRPVAVYGDVSQARTAVSSWDVRWFAR
jgi:hypothetical protein